MGAVGHEQLSQGDMTFPFPVEIFWLGCLLGECVQLPEEKVK